MNCLTLPEVTRVPTDRGDHVEPALDPAWSNAEKLAWHAAVVAHDTGLRIAVHAHTGDDGHLSYALAVGRTGTSAMPYRDAWTYLNGVNTGARAHQS